MTKYLVYGLYDLNLPDTIRYIGKSSGVRGLTDRIYHHKWLSRKETSILPSSRWIRKIGESQLGYRVLQESSYDSLNEDERKLISEYRELGQADLNILEGGEGRTSDSLRGELNPNSRTSEYLVERIRKIAIDRYVSNEEAAEFLGVNAAGASKILRNATWTSESYDPTSRAPHPESPWRGRPDSEVEYMRSLYLSGHSLGSVSRATGAPLTTVRRLVLEKHGSLESLKRCQDERIKRSDKLNKR